MKSIATKIVAIGKEIGQLNPMGRNDYDRYDFIGYEQLNSVLRSLLAKHNLALIPSFDRVEERDYTTGTGKATIRSLVYGKMTIVCGDTGDQMEFPIVGADQDLKGKSLGQAITEAVKRFELKLFHVSTKADIDPDSKSIEHGNQPSPPPNSTDKYFDWVSNDPELKKLCSINRFKRSEIISIAKESGMLKTRFKEKVAEIIASENVESKNKENLELFGGK